MANPEKPPFESEDAPPKPGGLDMGRLRDAREHLASPWPRVPLAVLREGDEVVLRFSDDNYDDTGVRLRIVSSQQDGSMMFGSGDIARRAVRASIIGPASERGVEDDFELRGSVFSPDGSGPSAPHVIVEDAFVAIERGVLHDKALRGIAVWRPDEYGKLHPLQLDQQENSEPSAGLAHAHKTIKELTRLLAANGFEFDKNREGSGGHLSERFLSYENNVLVSAVRQGSGTGQDVRYEFSVFDMNSGTAWAVGSRPREGDVQVLEARCISEDMLQEIVNNYCGENSSLWQDVLPPYGGLWHALSRRVPVTTYTWPGNSGDRGPTVTIRANGELAGDVLRRKTQSLKVRLGSIVLGLDHGGLKPSNSGKDGNGDDSFVPLEVNIRPEELPRFYASGRSLRSLGMTADEAGRQVGDMTTIVRRHDDFDLRVGGFSASKINWTPTEALEDMVTIVRQALDAGRGGNGNTEQAGS